jgi:hypothetical protein
MRPAFLRRQKRPLQMQAQASSSATGAVMMVGSTEVTPRLASSSM